MLLVGFDDTDSRQGGCTTSLAAAVLGLFPELEPEGAPRLVRLNPNVPWKTRGNAAIALRFQGSHDLDDALERVRGLLEERAEQAEGTSPGCVVADAALDEGLYERAVTTVVERHEAEAALKAVDARWWGGRGAIGAAAAVAWPAERTSWELIAYRDPARIGTPRDVDAPWLREAEWGYPTLFDTYDVVEDEPVAVPASPCPILWGLRGDDPDELRRAARVLGPEKPVRDTLFLTNQGTDDHMRDRRVEEARAFESARVRGRVAGGGPVEHNGTVLFEVEDATGALRAAAYPPTKSFRRIVQALATGDDVTVAGGLHQGPDGRLTLGVEKLFLHETAPRKAGNPLCPACGRAMKSAGRGAGYRCRACGTRETRPRTRDASLQPGWYEVPASARRHLAMPLKRMQA